MMDGIDAWAGGTEEVEAVLADAAAARAARSVARCAEVLETALRSGDAAAVLEDAAVEIRALRQLERLTGEPPARGADPRLRLERIVTNQLMASSALSVIETRMPAIPVAPALGRCLASAIRELLHVVETVADPAEGTEASLHLSVDHGLVTVVVETSPGVRAAPTASGMEALARLDRLARASGGALRRWMEDDRLAIGLVLGIPGRDR